MLFVVAVGTDLPGRMPLEGFRIAPLWIRASWSISTCWVSYTSKGSGVKDDLLWTERPVIAMQKDSLGQFCAQVQERYLSTGTSCSLNSHCTPDDSFELLMFLSRTKEPTSIMNSL